MSSRSGTWCNRQGSARPLRQRGPLARLDQLHRRRAACMAILAIATNKARLVMSAAAPIATPAGVGASQEGQARRPPGKGTRLPSPRTTNPAQASIGKRGSERKRSSCAARSAAATDRLPRWRALHSRSGRLQVPYASRSSAKTGVLRNSTTAGAGTFRLLATLAMGGSGSTSMISLRPAGNRQELQFWPPPQ